MWDVVIVGSGPAGLSAAVYTSRAGLKTVIVSGKTPGGLLTTTDQIDNYLGLFEATGNDLAENFLAHAQEFGAELVKENVEAIDSVDGKFFTKTESGVVYESKTVIYTAGSEPKKLHVPGEDLEGVSYCATCDGMFFEGEDVAVVGGGETAVEEAIYLSRMASSVNVLVRGGAFRATAPQVALLEATPNVTITLSTSITSVRGAEGVESVLLSDGSVLDVTGVFVAVGQTPQSHLAEDYTHLYSGGYIRESLTPGFFVAGDISNPMYRQVAVAVGDGAKAGIDATSFVLYGE